MRQVRAAPHPACAVGRRTSIVVGRSHEGHIKHLKLTPARLASPREIHPRRVIAIASGPAAGRAVTSSGTGDLMTSRRSAARSSS